MNIEYFKDQIKDELDGARCYIKNAIEIKAMNQSWAKTFMEMSAAELTHATNLYKMFEEYYGIISKSYEKGVPDYIEKTRNEIVDMYTECGAKIKYMHEMFSR